MVARPNHCLSQARVCVAAWIIFLTAMDKECVVEILYEDFLSPAYVRNQSFLFQRKSRSITIGLLGLLELLEAHSGCHLRSSPLAFCQLQIKIKLRELIIFQDALYILSVPLALPLKATHSSVSEYPVLSTL